jgi:hypothetical protein
MGEAWESQALEFCALVRSVSLAPGAWRRGRLLGPRDPCWWSAHDAGRAAAVCGMSRAAGASAVSSSQPRKTL